MNVTIINDVISLDSAGDEVTVQISTDYTVDLTDGTFTATNVESEVLEVSQPWNFNSDGARVDWADLDEAVAWFKQIKEHTGA